MSRGVTDRIAASNTALAPLCAVRQAVSHKPKEKAMASFRIVYGDDEQVIRETYHDVELQREDGWLVIFRDNDAILRAREEHVQSVETLDD
jgi:hypothetical protein